MANVFTDNERAFGIWGDIAVLGQRYLADLVFCTAAPAAQVERGIIADAEIAGCKMPLPVTFSVVEV